QRAARIYQGLPGQVELSVVLYMPGDEVARVRQAAVGERYARVGRAAGRRGDAGYQLTIDAVLEQEVEFFAATAEYERVAALQAHHSHAMACQANEQLVDFTLGQTMAPAGLAYVVSPTGCGQQVQQCLAHEAVIDQRIGLP